MYTVALSGERVAERKITLVFETGEGERRSEARTDHTGVASMWGPWSPSVQVLLDGAAAVKNAQWRERPADRFVEISAET